MRWLLLGLAVVAGAATVGLTAGAGAAVVLLLLAWATTLVTVRGRLARPAPAPRLGRRSARSAPAEDPALSAMTRRLFWGTQSRRQFDLHLRPLLTNIASTLLADRRGLDLDVDGAEVRAILGADAFDLIDPRRPPSVDERPADSLAALDRLLDRLETL